MNHEDMWNELKDFLRKTKEVTEQISTVGILNIIEKVERTQLDDDLPF